MLHYILYIVYLLLAHLVLIKQHVKTDLDHLQAFHHHEKYYSYNRVTELPTILHTTCHQNGNTSRKIQRNLK